MPGRNATDRQRIKRHAESWSRRYREIGPAERLAVIPGPWESRPGIMKPLFDHLIVRMRGVFGSIRNPHHGSNRQYALDDILMAAFSVFFMQSPSFLDHQRMAAARTACLPAVPCSVSTRCRPIITYASSSTASTVPTCMRASTLPSRRSANTGMQPYPVLGGRTLIALDGNQFHRSRKVHCPMCQQRVRNRGQENQYTE